MNISYIREKNSKMSNSEVARIWSYIPFLSEIKEEECGKGKLWKGHC